MERQARVKFDLGRTLNMGNYESVRINVGLEMDCAAEAEQIQSTYRRIREFVLQKLREEEALWKI